MDTWDIEAIKHRIGRLPLAAIPEKPYRHMTIVDPSKFITSHLAVCEAHNGEQGYVAYWNRLNDIITLSEQNREFRP